MAASSTALADVNIVDGDTLKIDGVTIRIVGIDTPETYRSRCENELVLGLKAKERLRALVDRGGVTYQATGTDRYGRTLARVFAGDVNVGETLLKEGYALAYRPGYEAKIARMHVWCS
jgi:endonuclease YncB( thermonuclease family)